MARGAHGRERAGDQHAGRDAVRAIGDARVAHVGGGRVARPRGVELQPGGRLAGGTRAGDGAALPGARCSGGPYGARAAHTDRYADAWRAGAGADPGREGVSRASFHSRQRSIAASRQSGKENAKPLSSRRVGTTRRLLRINSVSVRMNSAPISSISRFAGRPIGTPAAWRSSRMNSRLGSGLGAQTFTTPANSS